MFEEQNNVLGVAQTLPKLAFLQIKQHRNFEAADQLLEESISLQRQVPLTASFIETLRLRARVKSVLKFYPEAAQAFGKVVGKTKSKE